MHTSIKQGWGLFTGWDTTHFAFTRTSGATCSFYMFSFSLLPPCSVPVYSDGQTCLLLYFTFSCTPCHATHPFFLAFLPHHHPTLPLHYYHHLAPSELSLSLSGSPPWDRTGLPPHTLHVGGGASCPPRPSYLSLGMLHMPVKVNSSSQ